jgi:hypothetical protein
VSASSTGSGHGATFTVYLPHQAAEAVPAQTLGSGALLASVPVIRVHDG